MLRLNQLHQQFSRKLTIQEKQFLYFSGTAYLGIPANKKFVKLYQQGIKKFGLNNGTSRNNNIQLGIYGEAEAEAASRFNTESALIASSGYLAANLVVNSFASFGEIRYAPNTHTSLWLYEDPNVKGTFNSWLVRIVDEINQSEEKKWVIISNSMNNLFPEIYDFSYLRNIKDDKEVTLIVDDSHGIGVNNNGLSAMTTLPQESYINCIVVASMAKALGVDAGLVLASKKVIDQLKNTNVFIGASPPAAAGLYAFMLANQLYAKQREKLMENTNALANYLQNKLDWEFAKGFPAFLIKNTDIYQQLIDKNILISSFAYPTQDGEVINRIVLSSWHKKKDIERLKSLL